MECVCCGSAAVTERPERTAQGYRRFRCRDCAKQFNERSARVLNRTQYPSDVIPDLNSAPAQLAEFRPIIQLTWRLWCQHRSRCEFRPRLQPLNGG